MSTADHSAFHREREIFIEAIEKASKKEREAFLVEACAGDDALRERVERLLANHESVAMAKFLAAPATVPTSAAITLETITEKEGDEIGRYKLLELIGEGSFGRVWMAEQREPIRRRVALKILKLGMDTGEVLARFEAERQALAMMDHPHIAHVFDGGASESGRPYFVMELVRGVPITTYCDANKLPPRARIDLFRKVCEAVQHAHLKGIIHRDLKPSNILVTVQDDKPVPKVIDFGVAKALQTRLTERTLFTSLNQWIGTPEYMSPEQAGLGGLDVDMRSDVYTLGVILYELVTGRTPFDAAELRKEGYDAILSKLREQDPPKPSTRLSSLLREELAEVADHRSRSPEKLGNIVHGELDWILLKALERDRSRRYESASAFGEDLGRFSANEPISAAPPSVSYLVGKFLRRRRKRLAIGTVITLLVGLSSWLALRPKPVPPAPVVVEVVEPLHRTGGPLVATIEAHDGEVLDMAYSPERELLASCGSDRTIKLWRTDNLELVATLTGHDKAVWGVAFSPGGDTLISGGLDGKILLWDASTKRILHEFDEGPLFRTTHLGGPHFCISPDGGTLAAHGRPRGTIELWNLQARRLATVLDAGESEGLSTTRFEFSPDGTTLAFANTKVDDSAGGPCAGFLTMWHLGLGKRLWSRKADPRSVLALAFSPDGRLLATGNADHYTRIWDTQTGRLCGWPSIYHRSWVFGVAVSPDGRILASTTVGGPIALTSVASCKKLTDLTGHGDGVRTKSPVFFADGALLATGGSDGTIKIWDVEASLAKSRVELEDSHKELALLGNSLSTRILPSGTASGRYVKLVSEEVQGITSACIAELTFINSKGHLLPQGELSIHDASSFQDFAFREDRRGLRVRAVNLPENVLDGDPDTFWHSHWFPEPVAPFPHWITVDLGKSREIAGFLLKHRRDDIRKTYFLKWRFHVSDDAENWKEVSAGRFHKTTDWQGCVFGETESGREKNEGHEVPDKVLEKHAGRIEPNSIERGRYVRLVSSRKSAGDAFACIAELRFMDSKGALVPRGDLSAHSWSSAQHRIPKVPDRGEHWDWERLPEHMLDGDKWTYWHSRRFPGPPARFPHWIVIDLGESREISGFFVKQRCDGKRDGNFLSWSLLIGEDAEKWKSIAAGGFESTADWQGYVFDKARLAADQEKTHQLARGKARLVNEARKELAKSIRPDASAEGRYVRLLSEPAEGIGHAAIAELEFMNPTGALIPRDKLTVHDQSSFQDVDPEGRSPTLNWAARLAIDGNPDGGWHTRWAPEPRAPFPHWIAIDLGESMQISGFLLKHSSDPARHADLLKWRFAMSDDAEDWKEVAVGGFRSTADWQGFVFGETKCHRFENEPPDGVATLVEQLAMAVSAAANAKGRYAKLVSEDTVRPGEASIAELFFMDAKGAVIPQGELSINGSSSFQRLIHDTPRGITRGREPRRVLDGDSRTFWKTRRFPDLAPSPHWIAIDLGKPREFSGFLLKHRDGRNPSESFLKWRLLVSDDAGTWREVAAGGFESTPDWQGFVFGAGAE